jgi:hypothetical protein
MVAGINSLMRKESKQRDCHNVVIIELEIIGHIVMLSIYSPLDVIFLFLQKPPKSIGRYRQKCGEKNAERLALTSAPPARKDLGHDTRGFSYSMRIIRWSFNIEELKRSNI